MAKKNVSQKKIVALAKKVTEEVISNGMKTPRVFVFGSYAKGKARTKSDLDLCFVFPELSDPINAEAYLRSRIYFSGIRLNIPVDVVAYGKRDFEKGKTPLLDEIKKFGVEISIK
jgi:predicted nucleotidyltransferase